jgi:hypothetical protein
MFGYLDNIPKPKEITWSIRVLGVDPDNVLHTCSNDTANCKKEHNIIPHSIQTIKGIYNENKDNIICR